ncbi:hypothetical protein MKX01_010388 [Papaver californicum]|nr:hypothetical protein MKX01_010388 [Papaver californicum]
MVTFSKRRNRLISKAAQLCKFCSDIVLIVFSPAGKPYTFSNSSLGVCHIVEQFLADQTNSQPVSVDVITKPACQLQSLPAVQSQPKNHVVLESDHDDSIWWDNIDMEKLDSLEKLMSVRNFLAYLKQNLTARLEKLASSSHNAGKTWWKDRPELDHNFELQQSDKKATILMLEDEVCGQDEEVEDPSTVLGLLAL